MTKATNQGCQLVVFPDSVVGGHVKGNALGNKLAMGHEIIEKNSRHVQNMKHFARLAHLMNQV
jgi:predicted amidohydrolase